MRRTRVAAVVLLGVAAVGLADPPATDRTAAIRAKLRGDWQERNPRLPRDQQVGPNGGVTWEVFPADNPDLLRVTYWEDEAQQTGGAGVVNAAADPVWLDWRFTDAGRPKVQLGVMKFVWGRVLWEKGAVVPAAEYDRARGRLPGRPAGFTAPDGKPAYTVLERIGP